MANIDLSAPATIESEPDPRAPGRIAYRIHGPTWRSVQRAVDDLFDARDVVEASFIGPKRIKPIGWGVPPTAGRFGALGFVVSRLPVAAE